MPKTYNDLSKNMFKLSSIYRAFYMAVKGNKRNEDVIIAREHEEEIVDRLYAELNNLSWHSSPYRQFVTKKEYKRRIIDEPAFSDRVVHHLLVDNLRHLFERKWIFDSYAVTIGKGQHRAADRTQEFMRELSKNGDVFAIKADIRHYYESINHDILISKIRRTIRDKRVLTVWERVIREYHAETGTGIPIGAVTSQLSANIYLNDFDHFVKEVLRVKYYVRYMDDFIILSNDKSYLWSVLDVLRKYLALNLKLTLNAKTRILKIKQGLDFCGYRIFTDYKLPRKRNVKAAKKRFKTLSKEFARGKITYGDIYHRIASFLGYMKHCDGYKTTLSTLRAIELKRAK